MDPATVQLIIFAEQMAALAAKTIVQLRGILTGSSTQAVDEILAYADATYAQIIKNATEPQPPTGSTSSPSK